MTREAPPGREPGAQFAMVPKEIIYGAPDAECLMLYAYCDLRQGQDGWSARGAQYVADKLGWQARTVTEHAKHLEDLGWLERRREGRWAVSLCGRAQPSPSARESEG